MFSIRIMIPSFWKTESGYVGPDPALQFHADPDPTFHYLQKIKSKILIVNYVRIPIFYLSLFAVLSSVSSQPGLVNSNLLMQTKTFLAFYHHAEVKRKESPDVDRPEGVEKFVYNEKIFKEEPPSSGTPTLFTLVYI